MQQSPGSNPWLRDSKTLHVPHGRVNLDGTVKEREDLEREGNGALLMLWNGH